MKKRDIVTLLVALLGAVKLILEANGITVLDEGMINDIANGLATIVIAVGVFRNNINKKNVPNK
jgi:hypothetical protein